MPTDSPVTTRPTRRPWWVAPGVGALLGAAVIAVAAQGSLTTGPVDLPAGPRLAPSPVAPPHGSTVVASAAVVVAPVHAVVTQSAPVAAGAAGPRTPGAGASSGSGAAAATAGAVGVHPAPTGSPGGTSPTTEVPTTTPPTTTSPPTTAPTTTTTEHEPKDE